MSRRQKKTIPSLFQTLVNTLPSITLVINKDFTVPHSHILQSFHNIFANLGNDTVCISKRTQMCGND